METLRCIKLIQVMNFKGEITQTVLVKYFEKYIDLNFIRWLLQNIYIHIHFLKLFQNIFSFKLKHTSMAKGSGEKH